MVETVGVLLQNESLVRGFLVLSVQSEFKLYRTGGRHLYRRGAGGHHGGGLLPPPPQGPPPGRRLARPSTQVRFRLA